MKQNMLFDDEKVSVYDTASLVVNLCGWVHPMKLQKVVYFCQASVLARTHAPLFPEPLEAWTHGPVCPELFFKPRAKILTTRADKYNWIDFIQSVEGNPQVLNEAQRAIVEEVCKWYGALSDMQLRSISHRDTVWKKHRKGYGDRTRGSIMPVDEIEEYFLTGEPRRILFERFEFFQTPDGTLRAEMKP
jgi:uncharacterized phage-associated protein